MCTADGADQFGTTYMFGTGGDMDGGSTEAVMEVFFDPEAWDCLAFPDYFETGGKRNIGYFVPYTKGLNQFKDEEGITDMPAAEKFVKKSRDKLAQASSKKPLNDELQNNPIIPSEAFLVTSGNIFPIKDLSDHLAFLQASTSDYVRGQLGRLVEDEAEMYGVRWEVDLRNELEVAKYPVSKGDDCEGAIQIWEHPPAGEIPWGMYLAATDPYDQDQADSSASLGSTFIYKVGDYREKGMKDVIVAEYTGRPETAKEHHENVRLLCMYFQAENLYENNRNTLKWHFENKGSLHLLANTPTFMKANATSNVDRQWGQNMTDKVKPELEIYGRDWLTESRGDGVMNLHCINSIGLLKELIMYNDTGNFDRVIAFLLVIANRMQNHHVNVVEVREQIEVDEWWNRRHFVN